MSSFGGIMEEYNSISIDRFDGINLSSTVFMLSHNHKDHTVGLGSAGFQYRVQSNSAFKLYCSPVSRDLLLLDDCYAGLRKSVVPLEIDTPHVIDIPDAETGKVSKTVTVTLLQAGHCPGSVMFLFEGDEGTVLYTGDFRLTKQDLESYSCLHATDGRVKEIKSAYIDTTFCVPQAFFIPRREDCIDATIDIVREWISQSPKHIVLLSYKADLGYESMFMRLSEEFGVKIHVNPSKYEQYKRVGNLSEYVTSDPTETQIHACRWQRGKSTGSPLPCGFQSLDSPPIKVRAIKLSTMCFVQKVGLDAYSKRFSDSFFRVCYSFHSSYSEIRDLILYLKPERAFPNVVPIYDAVSTDQVQRRLNSFVSLAKSTHQSSMHAGTGEFGLLKSPKGRKRKHSSQQSSNSLKLIFDDTQVSSTPKKIKLNNDSSPLKPNNDGSAPSEPSHSDFPLLFGSQGSDKSTSVPGSNPDGIQSHKEDDGELDGFSDAHSERSEESELGIEDFEGADEMKPSSLVLYFTEDENGGLTESQMDLECNASDLKNLTIQTNSIEGCDEVKQVVQCSNNSVREQEDSEEAKDTKPALISSALSKDDDALTESQRDLDFDTSDLKDIQIHTDPVEKDQNDEAGLKNPTLLETKPGSPSLTESCNLILNDSQHEANTAQDTDFSDVIIVDDNSNAETLNTSCDRPNEINVNLNSSRTLDSDVTVDVSSSPFKRTSAQQRVLTGASYVADDYIDLTSDDGPLHPMHEFGDDRNMFVEKPNARRKNEIRNRFNSETDSWSDDYDGDDEFEKTDKESGYDSDAEFISNRKCTFECVIQERALRYSRTAASSSDVIVIDDDDEAGTSFPKARRHNSRYFSTESSSSSSSTGSLLSDISRDHCIGGGRMALQSTSATLFIHSTNKPRLWHPRSQTNTNGIAVHSSDDFYSS